MPLPPIAGNEAGVATAETPHFVVEADVTLWVDELHAPQAVATDSKQANTTPRLFPMNVPGDPARLGECSAFFARTIPALLISYGVLRKAGLATLPARTHASVADGPATRKKL
jgi:hypothetical protein